MIFPSQKKHFLLRPPSSPYLAPHSITERPAIFLSITRAKGALGCRSSVNSVQDHLTFSISRSGSCQPFLFRECHLLAARISAVAFQNPLYAEEHCLQVSPAFIVLVLPELQAAFPPRRPSCGFVVVIEVAVMFLVFLFWPPEVCSWLGQVQ